MDEHPKESQLAPALPLLCLVLCAAAGSALLACASSRATKTQELDLAQMMRWLPGTYSNVAQHEADVKAGKPPHEALAVAIVPIDSPIMGPHAFYFQESAADDPRRVMVQQVLSFELTPAGKIKESVATLVEPRRWRDGQKTPELFTAMVVEARRASSARTSRCAAIPPPIRARPPRARSSSPSLNRPSWHCRSSRMTRAAC
jgi:hypothetical protein